MYKLYSLVHRCCIILNLCNIQSGFHYLAMQCVYLIYAIYAARSPLFLQCISLCNMQQVSIFKALQPVYAVVRYSVQACYWSASWDAAIGCRCCKAAMLQLPSLSLSPTALQPYRSNSQDFA